ncbi:DNA-directed RNA polymerase core subunit rpc40 [Elasticomyces elasticus]|nr:DNA-directed RNA polymerase core subunit rpc40 [Elasticomyces elasticus]
MGRPNQATLDERKIVGVNAETVTNVSSTDFPGQYYHEDHSWNLDQFRRSFHVDFHKNDPYDAVFSMVGLDASVANAFRRILLAEIPTLALENIYITQNSSIIQDEVLSQRLGLIPLTTSNSAAIRNLKFLKRRQRETDQGTFSKKELEEEADMARNDSYMQPSDHNTVVMELDVECEYLAGGQALANRGERDPSKLYKNSSLYAKDLVFRPTGQQAELFAGDAAIRPTNPDILVAKLRPGQRITLTAHGVKGIGADHAKFSPVATASYRLLPHIDIRQPILGADVKKFARCFPKGVISLVNDETTGEQKAVVSDPMKDTVSRECLRHDEFKDKVKLGRVRDHFIFSVESSGQFESAELVLDSIALLKRKCETFKKCLDEVYREG